MPIYTILCQIRLSQDCLYSVVCVCVGNCRASSIQGPPACTWTAGACGLTGESIFDGCLCGGEVDLGLIASSVIGWHYWRKGHHAARA